MTLESSPERVAVPGEQAKKDAREWVRRLDASASAPADIKAFNAWLNASPENRVAYQQARQFWDTLNPAIGALLKNNSDAAASHAQVMKPPRINRRAFLGMAASVAAVSSTLVFYPEAYHLLSSEHWMADFSTATGEQKEIRYGTQIHLVLNTQTRIRQYRDNEAPAAIEILSGETAVKMEKGGAFGVIAGVGRSFAESGEFEVRYLGGLACVTCVRGEVSIQHPDGGRSLQAGQQAIYDNHSMGGIAYINTEETSAWRQGELVFNNTRLKEVIAEINRYRPGRVVLRNTSIQNSAMSGRFSIKDLDSALAQIQDSFSLSARALPGGWLVFS